MADINSQHAGAAKTEGDGISYRGIVVFVGILVVTTLVCELIVVGMYKMMDAQSRTGVARAPMAAPAGTLPPGPNLQLDEPATLQTFEAQELKELTTYGWLDKGTGSVRLPIDRAKELILERGLPVRSADAPAVAPDVRK